MKRMFFLLSFLVSVSIMGCSVTSKEATINQTNKISLDKSEHQETNEKIIKGEFSKYFKGYEGGFVLYDQNKDEYYIYNEEKSKKRMSPCSTFKIINSLIGLETDVLKDENTIYKWDGEKHSIGEWNKDHTLATAVSNSVVWYFKKVASEVGNERMQSYLNKINYGNKDISGGITQFWLQSSLKISPMEQVGMLRNLYNYRLPSSERNINIVKKIIKLSDQDGIILSGKTGSGGVNGWFVGYVERQGNVFYFATNIEAEQNATGIKAKEITMEILRDKNIIQK